MSPRKNRTMATRNAVAATPMAKFSGALSELYTEMSGEKEEEEDVVRRKKERVRESSEEEEQREVHCFTRRGKEAKHNQPFDLPWSARTPKMTMANTACKSRKSTSGCSRNCTTLNVPDVTLRSYIREREQWSCLS